MSDLVQLTKDDAIAIVTINNPPVNALSPGVPEGISEAIAQISKDDSVRAAVVIGGGRTFVAGADIKEFEKLRSGAKPRGEGMLPLLAQIEDCPKPIVMAIHGTAFGGGLELAMAGHYRVAAAEAQIGQPEVKLGIIPGAGGTQRLPRLVGKGLAMQMVLTGEMITAQEAHRIGLVNEVIAPAELIPRAEAMAQKIIANGPLAVQAVLRSLRETECVPEDQAMRIESKIGMKVFLSDDAKEGPLAFMQKRKPEFKGR